MARIDCPHCGKTLEYQSIKDYPHFPFCSERCKLVDLGKWLDEEHKISDDLLDEGRPTATESEDTKKGKQ
ncbi:MAG: DNA gyrase inhibitor YacG [Planctomycetes bacterium]|nr:DNA gyrase inhibitor YacG [Planctomycetota bacterium]